MTEYQALIDWLNQPITTGFLVALTVAGLFYWLGKKNGGVPTHVAHTPTEEELKKAQQDRDIARRKLSRNNIAVVLYKVLTAERKRNVRNSNVGLTSPEAYSIGCRLFTELRVPDALRDLKKELGISTPEKPNVDAPPAAPSASNNVDTSLEERMAAVKAKHKAARDKGVVAA